MLYFIWILIKMTLQLNIGCAVIYFSGYNFFTRNNMPMFNMFIQMIGIILIIFFGLNLQKLLDTNFFLKKDIEYKVIWCDEKEEVCILQKDTEKPFIYSTSKEEIHNFVSGKTYKQMEVTK